MYKIDDSGNKMIEITDPIIQGSANERTHTTPRSRVALVMVHVNTAEEAEPRQSLRSPSFLNAAPILSQTCGTHCQLMNYKEVHKVLWFQGS